MLPYGRQSIDDDDVQAVVDALRSDFITTGPKVNEFEEALAECAATEFAIAVSSGTAALHCAMFAIGVEPGDEVIVPTMTFAASANCVRYMNGMPVFADSRPEDLLIGPTDVERKVTDKTKAVIAVDYAGQPCDYDALREICDKHGLFLISDACHSIGSEYKGRKTASIADMTCFSFHPVKHITTGEGGACITSNAKLAKKAKLFRNHGITTDFRQREEKGGHFYEMVELGFNYRITDIQCALGINQLRKLPRWLERRREIAMKYDEAFANIADVTPLRTSRDVVNAYHLYVVKLSDKLDRDEVFRRLRENGIGVNIHYIPVHLHPYYRNFIKNSTTSDTHFSRNRITDSQIGNRDACDTLRSQAGRMSYTPELPKCPIAEEAYKHIISLPMFPSMTNDDIIFVIDNVKVATGG